MEFRILGPVEVWEDGHPVSLGGGKQRAVLALLLLNANRVVSSDALIEQLWDGHPPATAATALQGHVSSLRKALGPERIATRRPGYVLEVDPARIDLRQFEQLRAQGRKALERGDAAGGADKLREALELWRGAAVADIGFEPSIQAEAARLEDLRLSALEDRIDADLALGHSGDLIHELEGLVGANPLREHFWGQLMLALYRSGRQADALDAYRRARRTLVSELGLEPGPALRELERQMLVQDPALEPETPPVGHAWRSPRRRGPLLLAVAAVMAGAIVAVVLLATGGSDPTAIPRNAVVAIDPANNAVVKPIRLDPTPGPIAAGAGGLWVLSRGSWTLSRINAGTGRVVRSFGVGETPGNVAAAGEVWVSDRCSIGGDPGMLDHPFTGAGGGIELDEAISLEHAFPREEPRLTAQSPAAVCGLAAAGRSAWVATNVHQGIVQMTYDRGVGQSRIARAIRLPRAPAGLAVGFRSLWATDGQRDLIRRIDPASGRTIRAIRVGNDPIAIAAGAGAVWVVNSGEDSLSRIDPATNSVTKAVSVGKAPVAVAVGGGAVWVANSGDASVSRVDPSSNEVASNISVEYQPQGVAFAGGLAWVTLRGGS